MTANEGDVICVIGPSGSGKSTFLRCLNMLEKPTSGTIIVDDHEMTHKHVNLNKARRHIGMVFQHFNLFPHLTAKQNIMFAPVDLRVMHKKEAETRAMELLTRVGLADKADVYPWQLSGGQQQRVAIARALVKKPALILADEPTANLDSAIGREILELMLALNKSEGTTFIFSTHDQMVMDFARRLVRIRDGQIESDDVKGNVA